MVSFWFMYKIHVGYRDTSPDCYEGFLSVTLQKEEKTKLVCEARVVRGSSTAVGSLPW